MAAYRALCLNCGEYTEFGVIDIQQTTEFKGRTLTYTRKIAVCKKCGQAVYVPEINEENLDLIRFAYCKEMGLATEEDIAKVLDKYNISLKELAEILGCRLDTLVKYYKGALIKIEYSDKILRMLENKE